MTKLDAEKWKEWRDFNVQVLSFFAVPSFFIALYVFGLPGILGWAAYFIVGAFSMRIGMWLIDVIVERKDTEIYVGRAAIYLTWPISIPILTICALVATMFRFALDFWE